MKVYTSNDFTGFYPVGTAMVIVASNADEALTIAKNKCNSIGLTFDGTLDELDLNPQAVILCDGDY